MKSKQQREKIALGADHAGLALKEHLKTFLELKGFRALDYGTNSDVPSDYPDHAAAVAQAVAAGKCRFGVLVCGSGIGMAMAANRHPKIRAVNAYDVTSARLARRHNNANILTLGGRLVGPSLAEEIVHAFLDTAFEGGRHNKRVKKMDDLKRG